MKSITLFLLNLALVIPPCCTQAALSAARTLERISLQFEPNVLTPLRQTNATGRLILTGIYSDGSQRILRPSEAVIQAKTKAASGSVDVVAIEGGRVVPKEGGIATVEAVVVQAGKRLTASTDVVVAPFYRDYHQTLVLKLFLGMEGDPVERLAREPLFQKPHDVICTFEEAREVIRKADNLTRGIPKIVYLVGWQKGGHDHGYPAWQEVNPRLKRKQDTTALDSLRWLIREARRFNTTVSLHINMVDAYKQSPLFDEYVAKDCFARDASGQLLVAGIAMKGEDMYNVVYPKEWEAGLAQRRIDGLIKMIPELKEGHTIHIDVFIANREGGQPMSPWHAKPENGGLTPDKYVETQRKVFHYWRDRGFDVTGEGTGWAHPPGEHFIGLQPMSWWYSWNPMEIPECLGARGRTDRGGDGDFRFGSSMHGEEIWNNDKTYMPGFLGMFCRTTLPWYYLSRLERQRFENEVLYYSDGVVARVEGGKRIIRKGDFVLREDDHLFVPALWNKKEIIAYSKQGYENKSWQLPDNWRDVRSVDLSRVTLEGCVPLKKDVPVTGGKLVLSLGKDEAVSIIPAVETKQAAGEAGKLPVTDYGARPDDGANDIDAVRKAVDGCNGKDDMTLVFPKGTYDLADRAGLAFFEKHMRSNDNSAPGDYAPYPFGIALHFKGCRNLVVDGSGSTLMMRGYTQPFRFDDCTNVTLRNFTIDWDRPPFSVGKVIGSHDKGLDVEFSKDFPVESGMPCHVWQEYDPVTRRPTAREGGGIRSAELIGPQVLRLNFGGNPGLRTGQLMVFRHQHCILWGIETYLCGNVTFRDIGLHATPGIGFMIRGTTDVLFDRIRVEPRPGSDRIMSTCHDAIMTSVVGGKIELKDCSIAGMGDDGFSINSNRIHVEKRVDDHTVDAYFQNYSDFHWRPHSIPPVIGQHVVIAKLNKGITSRPRVSAVTFDETTGKMRVTFADAIPADVAPGDIVCDLERVAKLHIHGCTFKPNRSRGILVGRSSGAVCESNVFDQVGGTALMVHPSYGFRDDPVPEIILRNNNFINCGYAVANMGANGVVVLDHWFELPEVFGTTTRVYRNMVIEGNTFTGNHGPSLRLAGIDGLQVRGNRFTNPVPAPAIMLKNCSNAEVAGNTLEGEEPDKSVALESDCDKATVWVRDNVSGKN